MKIVFSKLALEELDDATYFYEMDSSGLGNRFRNEIRKAANRIVAYPKAWSVERGDVRKCLLHRFPYKLLYSVEHDHVFRIAVAHQHRRPNYWVEKNGK